ncbi:UDP-glucose 4-epimerase GalE [Fluviispira sanaruensis]|uniref:UDP-glucose 4-epimerase n=1 Tax=Fluviispira sanaruensis TaxID=2493639 RepID=A0A4P2VQS4_FLUSA|nr:UDP-glucose 4-epimerase GalE [Fluviispira sanaruensis]BBH54449.1 UDP-glucose 4-epimerase GalE [Fluviispira sanaruensis]
MKVLVTGGAGYIGSTICSALEDAGHTPIILDSLVTGRIEFIRDRALYKGDIADVKLLNKIFNDHPDINCTIHCAALIIVSESVQKPYEYYRENVAKSNELFENLKSLGCHKIVFSSSAAIYDAVPNFMVTEDSPLKPLSPYAKTKYMMEMILQDYCTSFEYFKAISLRYFNPIGADPKMRSGLYIENPSHVLGKLVDTATGRNKEFQITGVEWPTRDGSGIRDYIHVWDLAQAHVKAIENFDFAFSKREPKFKNFHIINLGTGRGVTVRELLREFENVFGREIPKKVAPSRPGDVAGAYANENTALDLLEWKATLHINQGIEDSLKWHSIREQIIIYNPNNNKHN